MKLEKAIEILELNVKEAGNKMPADCLKAIKLGIEAMEEVKYYRNNPLSYVIKLLPGETDENYG